jgi:hypothetical protein
LDRLRVTQSALLAVADEEIPQRIGFVSDQVFEPSAMRRWWQALWGSTARLGFASAAMLSVAIMVSALTRQAPAPPAPAAAPPQIDMAKVEARFEQRLRTAISKAVAEAEARQQANTKTLLSAAEERHTLEMKSIQLAVEQDLTLLQKRYNSLKLYMASADAGAAR